MEKPQHLTFVGLLSLLVFLVSVTSKVDAGIVLQCYWCVNVDLIKPTTNDTVRKGDTSCESPTSDTEKSKPNTYECCISAICKTQDGEHLHNYLWSQIVIYVAYIHSLSFAFMHIYTRSCPHRTRSTILYDIRYIHNKVCITCSTLTCGLAVTAGYCYNEFIRGR